MMQLNFSALCDRHRLIPLFVPLIAVDIVLAISLHNPLVSGRVLLTVACMGLTLKEYRWAKWPLVSLLTLQVGTLISFGTIVLIFTLGVEGSIIIPLSFVAVSLLSAGLSAFTAAYVVTNQTAR